MGQPIKITALHLENRTVELLAEGKTLRAVAAILSSECGQGISHSAVKRYVESVERAKLDVVTRSDKLKTKIIEAEFNTVRGCMDCIETLNEICQEARDSGDLHIAIMAIDKVYKGLDMMNRILGKYQVQPQQNTINFTEVNLNESRELLNSRINSIAARIRPPEDTEFTDE